MQAETLHGRCLPHHSNTSFFFLKVATKRSYGYNYNEEMILTLFFLLLLFGFFTIASSKLQQFEIQHTVVRLSWTYPLPFLWKTVRKAEWFCGRPLLRLCLCRLPTQSLFCSPSFSAYTTEERGFRNCCSGSRQPRQRQPAGKSWESGVSLSHGSTSQS